MGRVVTFEEIVTAVANLAQQANYCLGADVRSALERARREEVSPLGCQVLEQILANAEIASRGEVPICQDTGVAVVFVDLGQEVEIRGGLLYDAINEGVRRGYQAGFLRNSVVDHPLRRRNTGDNTPAVVHVRLIPGDGIRLTVAPKGAGSENMSALAFLTPAEGREGVKRFVVQTVSRAGPNPCPPVVVGVGLGGTFEKAALLAKEALLRPVGVPSPDPDLALLEREILEEINSLGIGPQGFGGSVTALAVHVEAYPCHIASLPVAVNLNCHAARHQTVWL
ncbi:MAG: fumarate hydratase [Moorellales bacterium]